MWYLETRKCPVCLTGSAKYYLLVYMYYIDNNIMNIVSKLTMTQHVHGRLSLFSTTLKRLHGRNNPNVDGPGSHN